MKILLKKTIVCCIMTIVNGVAFLQSALNHANRKEVPPMAFFQGDIFSQTLGMNTTLHVILPDTQPKEAPFPKRCICSMG